MVINQVHGLTLICDGRPSIGYSLIRHMFHLNFLMLSIFLGWGYNWKWKRHRNYNPICRGNYSSITGTFGHQCPKSGKLDSGGRTWFLSDYGAHSFRPGTRYYHWTGQTSQISNLCLRICREWRFRVKTSLLCFFRDALSTNLDWKSCKITFNMYSQMSIPQKTSSVLTWNKLLYHTSFFSIAKSHVSELELSSRIGCNNNSKTVFWRRFRISFWWFLYGWGSAARARMFDLIT